jgi:hypothetical protein
MNSTATAFETFPPLEPDGSAFTFPCITCLLPPYWYLAVIPILLWMLPPVQDHLQRLLIKAFWRLLGIASVALGLGGAIAIAARYACRYVVQAASVASPAALQAVIHAYDPYKLIIIPLGGSILGIILFIWYGHRGGGKSTAPQGSSFNPAGMMCPPPPYYYYPPQAQQSSTVEATLQLLIKELSSVRELIAQQAVRETPLATVVSALADLGEIMLSENASTRKLLYALNQPPTARRVRFASSGEESDSFSDEEEEPRPAVQVTVRKGPQKQPKRPRVAPKQPKSAIKSAATPRQADTEMASSSSSSSSSSTQAFPTDQVVTEDFLRQFAGLPLAEVTQKITELAGQRKPLPRPANLTAEEKALAQISLSELQRRWKEEDGLALFDVDFEDIGVLKDEEVSFSRRTVKDIIRQRRLKNRLQDMRNRGLQATVCDMCGRIVGPTHQCMGTNWTRPIRGGPAKQQRQVVVSQDGVGSVRLQQRQFVDPTEVEKAYQKVQELKHVANQQLLLQQPAPIVVSTPPPPSSSSSSSSSAAAVDQAPTNMLAQVFQAAVPNFR